MNIPAPTMLVISKMNRAFVIFFFMPVSFLPRLYGLGSLGFLFSRLRGLTRVLRGIGRRILLWLWFPRFPHVLRTTGGLTAVCRMFGGCVGFPRFLVWSFLSVNIG